MSDRFPGRAALPVCAALALTGCTTLGGGAFVDASVGAGDDPRELAFAWQLRGAVDRVRVEADPDGASGFVPVDVDRDGDADGHDSVAAGRGAVDLQIPLHATDFARARYRLVALAADGDELDRSAPLAIAGIAVERLVGRFASPDAGAGGWFGARVALSADGSTLAVGAPGEAVVDSASGRALRAGSVHVFARAPDGGWSRQGRISASNAGVGDRFGASLALSADGGTLVAGAPGEGGAAAGVDGPDNDGAAPWAGAAYVFTRDPAGTWTQQAYVKASNPGPRDSFGARLALSGDGDTLAVGAWGEDGAATGIDGADGDIAANAGRFARGAGAVYVFTRARDGAWSQQAYVKASNTGANDWFGDAVALSADGDTLAVGASKQDGAAGGAGDGAPDAGAVYLFARDRGGAWSQRARLEASNPGAGDGFGVSVALSAAGDTLAVGAWGEDSAAAGTNGPDDDGAPDAGAVYLFARDRAGAWSQRARVKASNPDPGDVFGARVALSAVGDHLAVGAWGEDGDATGIDGPDNDNASDAGPFPASAGAVYVFTRNAGGWRQRAYVKAPDTGAGDVFGDSVALSADGAVLAVGASNKDGERDGGEDSAGAIVRAAGAAYLY